MLTLHPCPLDSYILRLSKWISSLRSLIPGEIPSERTPIFRQAQGLDFSFPNSLKLATRLGLQFKMGLALFGR